MTNRIIDQTELFERYYVSFFGINLFPVTLWGRIHRKKVVDEAMTSVDLFLTPLLHFGGDDAFNLLLFPYLKRAFLIKDYVSLYRWGGLTSGFNRHMPELLGFSDFRIRLLDQYCYSNGYTPLFIEYVNLLLSHLLQLIEYKHLEEKELLSWLETERKKRYIVGRMRDYFKSNDIQIPEKCKMAIMVDTSGLLSLAKRHIKHQRLRGLGKILRILYT